MIFLTSHGKVVENEWAMQFKFSDPSADNFDEVHDWFEQTFHKNEAWMGWRSDRSALTVFFNTERAYAFSLLRWK